MKTKMLNLFISAIFLFFCSCGGGGEEGDNNSSPTSSINNSNITITQVVDPTKGDCLIAGMLLWNPNTKSWERRVNYYNNSPYPCSTHTVFYYVNNLKIPSEQGSNWESRSWFAYSCLDGCGWQTVVENKKGSNYGNDTVVGFFVANGNVWEKHVVHYNGAPVPCDNHKVFNYLNNTNPNFVGALGEIWGTTYFSSYEGCSNGLEMTDIETVHISDSGKGDCYVSASFTWNPNKNSWIPQVKYYNNTPVPCQEHSAYVYIRTLPVPTESGTTPWETKGWKSFNCNCIDY